MQRTDDLLVVRQLRTIEAFHLRARQLNDLAGKYRQAELAILSMAQEVATIELAWTRIKQWSESSAAESMEATFLERLDQSLDCGSLVINALQRDLFGCIGTRTVGRFKQRSKVVWNERGLHDHQDS